MKKLLPILILWLLILNTVNSQTAFPNTLFLQDSAKSPKATLSEIQWIAGHWRGEAFGGITEEIWSPMLGGSMMGSFKLVVNNEVQFYELMTITEEKGSLMMRLKHFNANLSGWEEKEETVDFALVKIEGNKVFFDGLTFEKINENEINVYVVIEHDEEMSETKFNYKRIVE